jgi:hypothetical protein
MSNAPSQPERDRRPEDETEAAIIAGGDVVGTADDGQPLVEGPNSE